MLPIFTHQLNLSKEKNAADPAQRLKKLFGRTRLRENILLIPELPHPLPRQKKGYWRTYDIAPAGAHGETSGGITAIQTGATGQQLLRCLGYLFSALGKTARRYHFHYFGSAYPVGEEPFPATQSITPASYALTDSRPFITGGLSILYRQPFSGIANRTSDVKPGLTIATVTGLWPQKVEAKLSEARSIGLMDLSSYWFVAFMNGHRIRDYSINIVPAQGSDWVEVTSSTDALSLSLQLKNLIDHLQYNSKSGETLAAN